MWPSYQSWQASPHPPIQRQINNLACQKPRQNRAGFCGFAYRSERLPNYACFPPLVRFAAEAAFVADVDAAFVQKILNIPQRERKPHIHHHSQADDLGARLEVTKGETLCHRERLGDRPARLNRFCSDSAVLCGLLLWSIVAEGQENLVHLLIAQNAWHATGLC